MKMGQGCTLAFWKHSANQSYAKAVKEKAVYKVDLDYAEAHKGLCQTAVWDAFEIINEVKKCFGIADEPLGFVLLDGDQIVDAG
jgi:hypothetical protein